MTNDCKTCPVSTGTHKPAEAVHQIAEPAATPWKDHRTAALVNDLRDCAKTYGNTQQLRERIANIVAPLCDQLKAAELAAVQQGVQPLRVADSIAPTFMTNEQAIAWAWADVRKDVGTENWTTGDSCNFYGFFLHGWHYREQYELQRNATKAAVTREIFTHPTQQGLEHDAARYRWLRATTNTVTNSDGERIDVRNQPEVWDKAIDAALAAQAKQGGV